MIIELTDEQLSNKEKFKRFAETKVLPYAKENDIKERINPTVVKDIAEMGYLGSMISKRYGGKQWDNITIGLLNEEIGKCCSAARVLLTVHGMVAVAISRWGTAEQKGKWLKLLADGKKIGAFALSEPEVGSDAKNVQTLGVEEGEYIVLNGTKKWITMGQIGDVFIIFGQLNGLVTAFLVEADTPGFSMKPMKGLLGTRGSMLAELHLNDCKIPKENIIGKEGTGLTHIGLSCLDYGRYTVAWGCIGIAQACLEASIKYASERKQFGDFLSSNQLIQKMITEMTVNIKAARLLCYQAGYLKDQGSPDSIMETWNAKYFSSIMASKVANDAVQIHGGNGCHDSYPIERYFRDARINEIIEGTTQMHEILISREAFRQAL
ncbi:acyl-CoA dehydrogenase family protein [Bacillus wiedmannii]|uniref:acyl-CoA dehydrogenase family protein n=1 Tax=Bacillus wiedmannii TaxID=1890302 RepID=UPI000B43991A|nr:acyl-CoA dehydrogenase [Bacillus thuringiensis serovar argentinensis]